MNPMSKRGYLTAEDAEKIRKTLRVLRGEKVS
jgi:hypothetical protein